MATHKSITRYETEAHYLEDIGKIEWSSVIFVPFHPVFKLLVLFSVIVKTTLGPIQSVYPIVYCTDAMDIHPVLSFIKYFYWYGGDSIYGIDTFLHIVHRQVTDKAMRREHLPKSAFLILLDILSLIPFFRLVAADNCPAPKIWPNMLAFNEFLIIYRSVEYFTLLTTHNYVKICIGFTVIMASCVNCVTSFWLMLTYEGLCDKCEDGNYDWRNYVQHKFNETNQNYTTYIYGTAYICTFALNFVLDNIKPSTILEFQTTCLFMICGYLFSTCIVLPKAFAEALLRLQRIAGLYSNVQKNISEAKRRHENEKAHEYVKNFYVLMWKERSGITGMPSTISEIPQYLKVEVSLDLAWQFYYHSPTLRKTSNPFKRWLSEYIKLDYKLPGENLNIGPKCLTNLYYIKSGVVQLISKEDGKTPILSLTSGTILGDVCFLIPPMQRKVIMRCLTYCEIIYAERKDLLMASYKYPKDRKLIMKQTQERLEHARNLFSCKQYIRGLDRAEDEGISWIFKRWWQLNTAVSKWKKVSRNSKDYMKFVIPSEETVYHCAKYIGQLVLCTEEHLQMKSMFANIKFPWILNPDSTFGMIWHRVVVATVFMVLLTYPPNLTRPQIPGWFKFIQIITDFVFTSDVCVSLMTCMRGQEQDPVTFASVMFARGKSLPFILDVLAAIWTESLATIVRMPDYYYIVQFNRLLKLHVLFYGEYAKMNIITPPIININYKIILSMFTSLYVTSYLIYEVSKRIPDITQRFFFGNTFCEANSVETVCDPGRDNVLSVYIAWTFEMIFNEIVPKKLIDMYYIFVLCYFNYMLFIYCKSIFIACLYTKYRDIIRYKNFVKNLKDYYMQHNIHTDLLERLVKYLECHWKYYKGTDMMKPNMIKDEPNHVYWKVQGEVAEKVIGKSKAFVGADPALIRELANVAQFMILPMNSTILMFGAQCRNVTWIVQGTIQCEYHDESGELIKTYYDTAQPLSVSSIFLGKTSMRTYTSYTECEIMYIRVQDFFHIIKRFPTEWSFIETCIKEIEPQFEVMFHEHLVKHRDYQHELRRRLYSARMSMKIAPAIIADVVENEYRSSPLEGLFWGEPDADFMQRWFIFRAFMVFVSIVSAALQGGIGANHRWTLIMIGAFCDCVAWIDIGLKLFLGYYNEQGLLITDKKMCLMHYLTRGFILDVIGAVPLKQILVFTLTQEIEDDIGLYINMCCKFAHLYIVADLFNYLGDNPNVNMALIMIVKWQVINILIAFGASHFLMTNCIDFTFDAKWKLIGMDRLNTCWVPTFMELGNELTLKELHIVFIESFNLVQSGLIKINFGKFIIDREHLGVGFYLIFLGIVWWYITCYSLTLLLLSARDDSLYQHGISQLKKFLEGERVDSKLIYNTVSYFKYSWFRNRGVNIHKVTYERLGVVFRQDLTFFFYRRTFIALDTVLLGGEALMRQLASACRQTYFLPGQDIVREMNLSLYVFIVHRGKVVVSKDGDRVITLTKGCIFGQLTGRKTRPIRVTVTADQHVDVLRIPIAHFHDVITDEVKKNINKSTQAKFDFMSIRKKYPENPIDTIPYILRKNKTIHIPWMRNPSEARRTPWYRRWLFLVWFCEPFCTAFIVIMLGTFPLDYRKRFYWGLGILDIIHLGNLVSEFFTVKLYVEGNKCVHHVLGKRHFKDWELYIDTVSLIMPLVTIVTGNWHYQLARLLRLRLLYDFEVQFCRNFKSKVAPMLLRITFMCLLLHTFTCGWIYVACRNDSLPVPLPKFAENVHITIDDKQWVQPHNRKGGCPRRTRDFRMMDGTRQSTFVVPKHWQDDYIVALTYILFIQTFTGLDSVVCLSTKELYYKVIVTFIIYLMDIWILSTGINLMYTKFRELYQYDYKVNDLITYLKRSGISPILKESVLTYTKQLWRRQRGNWLPELVYQAPACLREDLFGSLYMYHLDVPSMYRNVPNYFKRQMGARFKRVVIFPGKCIVREGDISDYAYFIHEGEVEKWYSDENGESKMLSLLSTNAYFGVLQGITNIPFQFSYYTRTVVDLVYLKYTDWQDLLESYPNVRKELFNAAKDYRRELTKQQFGKKITIAKRNSFFYNDLDNKHEVRV